MVLVVAERIHSYGTTLRYKANPAYARDRLAAALEAGARSQPTGERWPEPIIAAPE
jgi:hypothetical protein